MTWWQILGKIAQAKHDGLGWLSTVPPEWQVKEWIWEALDRGAKSVVGYVMSKSKGTCNPQTVKQWAEERASGKVRRG